MKKLKTWILALLSVFGILGCGHSQNPAKEQQRPALGDAQFDATLLDLLSFSVPTLGVQELKNIQTEVVIFDARESEEYEVSHIPGAKWIGFKHFNEQALKGLPKNQTLVVYCSVGYRSEKIGEKLLQLGFTRVYNLYGSIFEWVNQGNPVMDSTGKPTARLHTYNKNWSRWVKNRQIEKIW